MFGYVFHDTRWPKSWRKIEDPVVPLERNLCGHRFAGLGMSVTWMISKWLVKKQNLAPMWNKLMKTVDIEAPTSFLDRVYLGCTQRECNPNETIIEQNMMMFESRISAGKFTTSGKNVTHKQ